MAGSSGATQEQMDVRRDFKKMVATMPVEECRAMMERMAGCMEAYTVEVMMGRKPWRDQPGWKDREGQL